MNPYKHFIGTNREKNALKFAYLQKALAFIDSELELLKLKVQYPEQFQQSNQQIFISDLYLIPKSKGLGIIGIAEIVIALFLLGEIVGKDGKPVPLVRLAHGFEQHFNFSFGSVYDKVEAIFIRKPFNLTKTLDTLRNAIIKEDRKRKNQ